MCFVVTESDTHTTADDLAILVKTRRDVTIWRPRFCTSSVSVWKMCSWVRDLQTESKKTHDTTIVLLRSININ